MNGKTLIAAALTALFLAGCASGLGSGDYARSDARKVYDVRMGVVESVRAVELSGSQSGVGAATGAVAGGVAGSTIGSGKGSVVGAVVGAVAGGLAGAAVEKGVTEKPGIELTIRLNSGRTVAIVQEDTGERFNIGDHVRILESDGQARVTH